MKQIGHLIGTSESFISLVKNKKRNLTINHLFKLEEALKEPVPLILLKIISKDSVPKDLRPLYNAVKDVLLEAAELNSVLKKKEKHAHQKADLIVQVLKKYKSKVPLGSF